MTNRLTNSLIIRFSQIGCLFHRSRLFIGIPQAVWQGHVNLTRNVLTPCAYLCRRGRVRTLDAHPLSICALGCIVFARRAPFSSHLPFAMLPYVCHVMYIMRVIQLRCATYETRLIFVIYVKLYSRPGPSRREATHVHCRASTKHTRPVRASHANAGWTCERHLDT